jgi:hypothetical protein
MIPIDPRQARLLENLEATTELALEVTKAVRAEGATREGLEEVAGLCTGAASIALDLVAATEGLEEAQALASRLSFELELGVSGD